MICYAKINLLYDLFTLQNQVNALLNHKSWQAHYNKIQYAGDWEILSLRALNGDASLTFSDSLNGEGFKNTKLLNKLPEVEKILNQLKCEKNAVRLLNLKAGAIIKPHRDFDLCYEKGEARIHLPIFTNEKVIFRLEEEVLPMKAGDCWYINANLTHEVANNGTEDRVHLVIDCLVNGWVSQLFNQAQQKTKIVYLDKALQLRVIESLRIQNTETANALADKILLQLKINI